VGAGRAVRRTDLVRERGRQRVGQQPGPCARRHRDPHQQQHNLAREATTNAEGTYRFVNVQPGTYKVRVSLTGFKEYVKDAVPVASTTVTRIDVPLEVGALTETITVQSETSLLQTDTGDVHAQLGSKEITSLPLGSYRNYQSLVNLVPGATPAGSRTRSPTPPSAR